MAIADQYKVSNFGQLFWRHQPIKSKVTLLHPTEFNAIVLHASCTQINDAGHTRVCDAKYPRDAKSISYCREIGVVVATLFSVTCVRKRS